MDLKHCPKCGKGLIAWTSARSRFNTPTGSVACIDCELLIVPELTDAAQQYWTVLPSLGVN